MEEKTNAISTNTQPIPDSPPPDYSSAAREHGLPALRQSAPIRKGGPQPLDLPILRYLKSHRVILASASPRRRALLAQLGLSNLEIQPSGKPENISKAELTAYEYVAATARQKALDVYEAACASADKRKPEPALVIAADTVIATREGAVLEKPPSEAAHIAMLKRLRDTHVHRVLTAVCCIAPKPDASFPGYVIEIRVEETRVYFARETDGLPDDLIESYVRTREGVDKAGGYAIQGVAGMILVERVEGSVDNVVGLPVRATLQLCEKVLFQQEDEEEDGEEDGEHETL